MNSKAASRLRALAGLVLALSLAPAPTPAQQPSPSPQKPADAKTQNAAPAGERESDYTVTSSVELGYRGLRVNGDINKYQSDLNYKAGPRVFDSSFLMKSKSGDGPLDTLLVTTTGWGADPHGSVRVTAENSDWFRFDGSYRRFRYFRHLNNIVNPNYAPPSRQANPVTGQRGYDTRQQVGDFDLTLLPKNDRVRFNIGFSPTRYRGPAFTHYRNGGDEFLALSNLDSRADDWRLGADWKLGPVDFSFQQGFRRFKDESYINDQNVNVGNNPTPSNAALTRLERTNPIEGKVDYSRFSAHTLLARRLDITGRVVYSVATNQFNFLDTFAGTNYNTRITNIPGAINPPNVLTLGQQNFVGDTKRPSTLADLGVTYLATGRFRISNTFRFETFQINGGALYNGLFNLTRANGTGAVSLRPTGFVHEWTKYRKFLNTVEGDYEFNNNYSIRLGYRYGTRRIERSLLGTNLASNGAPAIAPSAHEEENQTHGFIGGIKARPVKGWTLSFDVERGTADNVFTRVGNYDYWNFRARSRYQVSRNLRFNVGFLTRDNSNPGEVIHDGTTISLADFGVEMKSRVFTSSFDWTANHRLSFSGGYSHNWQENDAVVEYAFLSTANSAIRGRSLYFMRNHFFHFDTVAQVLPRATLYASYRVNKDLGQGDRVSAPAQGVLISSYPMSFQSPEARLSIRISRRLDWNLGYQYFNYNESKLAAYNLGNYIVSPRPQNYNAHLPYVSLRFYFGNSDR
ncbi:MAG TPA: hypothetical protein VEY09_14545 [Pyrinomonadaceae bacterium]|nr:hypothetical protein [Pyrinomonadaceae bacterium]